MKTQLTKEQSQHIINLGVPKEKASMSFQEGWKEYENGIFEKGITYPIFRLTDLLEILPKELKLPIKTYIDQPANLVITGFEGEWSVEYEYMDEEKRFLSYISFDDWELIEALYQLVCWYYGEHLKMKRNERKLNN